MALIKRDEAGGDEDPERPSKGPARRRTEGASQPLAQGLAEVLAIGREMLAIPAAMALGLAERLGLAILAVLRFLRPIVLATLRMARRAIDVAARALTPARAVAAVALAAAVLLAVSQFLDYREVRAGVPAYAEVEEIAPPPQVSGSTETAGSAHAYVLLLAALAAGALIVLAMLGRWRLARLLFPIGLLAVVVVVLVDAPAGLDEGATAIQFEGAEARLLGPFWVQIAAASVIALCGPLLAMYLRPQRAPGRGRRPERSARLRRPAALGGSPVQGAGDVSIRSRVSSFRIERLLPFAIVAAALVLFTSELMTTFEFTPPGAEPLADQGAGDRHYYAQMVLAVFAVVAMVVALATGSKPAATAVAACGVIALLIFLLLDLPDANAIGTLDDPRQSFFEAEAIPQAGFWMELVGALGLALSGAALATLTSEQITALGPGGGRPNRQVDSRRSPRAAKSES